VCLEHDLGYGYYLLTVQDPHGNFLYAEYIDIKKDLKL
tara:strand:- start:228 stop:341 length:114 start_codon:yes stop_codon:yes gene_type:complete